MAKRVFRLVFDLTVTEETESALPNVETIQGIVEDACPAAMVDAIEDWIESEENEDGEQDTIALVSVDLAPASSS